jgi:hypothetical protein
VIQSTFTVSAVELNTTSTLTPRIVSVPGIVNQKFVTSMYLESPNENVHPKLLAFTIAGVNVSPHNVLALPYIAGFPPVNHCARSCQSGDPATIRSTESLFVGSIGVAVA